LEVERPFDDEDLLRVWLPDDRVFEAAGRDVLLFDDAGGEDVRVAMLANLHIRHTRPAAHTPGGGDGLAACPDERVTPVGQGPGRGAARPTSG
jgi:hypothetical protein